jgi:hypothetical protein
MEALWATILFSGFALEVIIRQEDGREFPAPSAPQPGELMIELPPEAVRRIKALEAR